MRRTRLRPGPLFLATLLCLSLLGGIVHAHDPGLSALEVQVAGNAISASLSIAAPDVALIASRDDAVREKLIALVRDAVRFSVDGEVLPLTVDEVLLDEGAARMHMASLIPNSRIRPRRLLIASDLPARMSSGHRELITVEVNNRLVMERLLDAASHTVTLDLAAESHSSARAAWQFLKLGVLHILTGYDHLVFLAGLLMAARTVRDLIVALTSFTAAHSLSLALVAIGGVHAPPWIVEPLIAASIAWVGFQNLLHVRHSARAFVVFGFGLIHGFGLAGALMNLGVGSSGADVVLALLSFNIGVEAGQLAVAAGLLPLVWMVRSRPVLHSRMTPLCSVGIVLIGGYWLIERLT